MSGPGYQRRLAAILVLDVVDYSLNMSSDETGTLGHWQQIRTTIIEPAVRAHQGRIVKLLGDGALCEFGSVVDSVRCALAIQSDAARSALKLRIGVHLGDVIVDGQDIYGDGVNVAARLEAQSEPGGVCISKQVFEQVENKIVADFRDGGEKQVKNIPRAIRIYHVTPTGVSPSSDGRAGETGAGIVVETARPVFAKEGSRVGVPPSAQPPRSTSIVVLPFRNLSADQAEDYFVDSIVEELIAALSRVRGLMVIGRNSSFFFRSSGDGPTVITQELGVRYALVGSVRKSGSRVRVTIELIDGPTGANVWADRFNEDVADIFDLQDNLTVAIVGALLPSLRASEIERARRKRPDSLDAYDCVMRAMPAVWSNQLEGAKEALDLLDRAILLEPEYGLALALSAWVHMQHVIYLRAEDATLHRARAAELAERAAKVDRDDPLVLTTLGAAHTMAGDLDRAGTLIEEALRRDPNSAWAWQRSGWFHTYRGLTDIAIEHFAKGLRISPFDPINFNSHIGTGTAHFCAGDYESAIEWIRKGLNLQPDATWAHRILAPALVHAGRLEEAQQSAGILLARHPDFTIKSHMLNPLFRKTPFLPRIVEGLRLAGFPTDD